MLKFNNYSLNRHPLVDDLLLVLTCVQLSWLIWVENLSV